jgi:Cof subfamily protein (haloacid dehalogenase superfamily)
MRKIKMIVCDVDGTLLNKDGSVLMSTLESIDRIRKQGILFGLATGRDGESVERFYKVWGLEGKIDFFVCSNGAHLKDYRLNLEKHSNYIEPSVLKALVAHFEDLELNFMVNEKGFFFVPKEDEIGNQLSLIKQIPNQVVDFETFLNEPKAKFHILCAEDVMPKVIERSKTFLNPLVKGVQTEKILYEYFNVNNHKANGIKEIADLHQINLDEIMAFGDSDNDVEMLLECGIGVAMGNATILAKKAANAFTQDNDHDGISNYIENFFLGTL